MGGSASPAPSFERAAEGTRTLDLLHGGLSVAMKFLQTGTNDRRRCRRVGSAFSTNLRGFDRRKRTESGPKLLAYRCRFHARMRKPRRRLARVPVRMATRL